MNRLSAPSAARWALFGFLATLALITLGACATFEKGISVAKVQIQQSPEFAELVLADALEARKLAEQTNDKLAVLCWDYIAEFTRVNSPDPDTPIGQVIGVLSGYQKARNVRRTVVEVEISDEFRIACGPMLTESMGALGRLGIRLIL